MKSSISDPEQIRVTLFQSYTLKYKYNMNPLTVTWAPHIYTDIGFQNFQNWINIGGFDNYLYTPNGKIHRLLTKEATKNLLHPFQPYNITATANQISFFDKVFNSPVKLEPHNQIWYWKELFTLISMIVSLIMLIPLTKFFLTLNFFKSSPKISFNS